LVILPTTLAACASTAPAEEATESSEDATVKGGMLLVSDIDDTIKRTDVHDKLAAAAAATESRNAFSGMSTLYGRWRGADDGQRKVIYLSAAPGSLIELSKRFLTNSGFPGTLGRVEDVVISGRSLFESAGDFKTQKLEAMYDALVAADRVPGTIVLVGDNGEQDMIAYGNFLRYVTSKGGRTDRIHSFIHHVYDGPDGSPIVAPHVPWVTASDLAVRLSELGLLSDSALAQVLAENAKDAVATPETVVPSFMTCATFASWPASTKSVGTDDYARVKSLTTARCAE
ncbi:MAG: phosphatase domain-containing protein, partial [Polyangiaceae bacterium]